MFDRLMSLFRREAPVSVESQRTVSIDGVQVTFSARVGRPRKNEPMDEQINIMTSRSQHEELLRLAGMANTDKSKILRAALNLAMPVFERNPDMIEKLQP